MVDEVRIYIEGGGDQRSGKAAVREGFSKFLSPLRAMARERHVHWNVIACGSRNDAFHAFGIALRQHTDAFNVLLVDSEGPVVQSAWVHLQSRDHWAVPAVSDKHCHLMVQAMEAWIIADLEALMGFYGDGFIANAIPRQEDVEMISKPDLGVALRLATQNTQKGEYHKIRHGPKILALLDVSRVRNRARHCERIFTILKNKLEET